MLLLVSQIRGSSGGNRCRFTADRGSHRRLDREEKEATTMCSLPQLPVLQTTSSPDDAPVVDHESAAALPWFPVR